MDSNGVYDGIDKFYAKVYVDGILINDIFPKESQKIAQMSPKDQDKYAQQNYKKILNLYK